MPSDRPRLTVADVQKLARAGKIAKDPAYHANQKAIRFQTIENVLAWCVRVEVDSRPGHRDGYVAWGQTWEPRRFRVDFNLEEDGAGERIILVVTAMELTE